MKIGKGVIWLVALCAVLGISALLYPRLKAQYETPALAYGDELSEEEQAQTEKKLLPDLTVIDADGNTVALSDYYGKPVVINFWATWCGPCREELPYFQNAYEELGEDIAFLMVNLTDGQYDTIESVQAFATEEGYTFPIYYDTTNQSGELYGISAIPVSMFVRPDGTLMDYALGTLTEEALRGYVDNLLAEK